MSGKRKLKQFAELSTFKNVTEVPFDQVLRNDHSLKGRWAKEVFENENDICVELGCGKGEYTVGLAEHYSDRNFIGVDIKGARMWKGAKYSLEQELGNAHFLRTRIEFIESFFGKNEISEIWITFPDPQPRKGKERKRLTSPLFFSRYFKFLKPGGIVHLKTDSKFLYEYTDEIINQLPVIKEISSPDLYGETGKLNLTEMEKDILRIPTFYEKMFTEKGHIVTYIKMKYAP